MAQKIYFLDDEEELCELFHELFMTADRQIFTFNSPRVFLEQVRLVEPDLIFLDFRMPGLNGIEVANRLQGQFPIVMMSGDVDLIAVPGLVKTMRKPIEGAEIESFLRTFANSSMVKKA